jgi:hypothetical protein
MLLAKLGDKGRVERTGLGKITRLANEKVLDAVTRPESDPKKLRPVKSTNLGARE